MLSMIVLMACAHRAPEVAAPAPVAPASPGSPAPTAEPLPDLELQGEQIGGDRWGFVIRVSPRGRTAVLGRFPQAEGRGGPEFYGHHGEEAMGAELVVIDAVNDTEREVDDLVGSSPDGRWLVVIIQDTAWLVDGETGSWSVLDEGGPPADMAQDHNRCLEPRTASFDALGRGVAYVSAQGVVMRDLAGGGTRVLPVQGRLWRAWPRADGLGATALLVSGEVKEDDLAFPAQNTSCACRWCMRFSMSYGFYGWGGPAFAPSLVTATGQRELAGFPQEAGGGRMILGGALLDADGAAVPLPEGCQAALGWPELEAVALVCGEQTRLWSPGRDPVALGLPPGALEGLRLAPTEGALLLPPEKEGGKARRLDTQRGTITEGPPADQIGEPTAEGLVLVTRGEAVSAWDLRTGESWPVPLPQGASPSSLGTGLVYLEDDRAVRVHGRTTTVLERVASGPTRDGCVLVASAIGSRGVERGPWTWSCP